MLSLPLANTCRGQTLQWEISLTLSDPPIQSYLIAWVEATLKYLQRAALQQLHGTKQDSSHRDVADIITALFRMNSESLSSLHFSWSCQTTSLPVDALHIFAGVPKEEDKPVNPNSVSSTDVTTGTPNKDFAETQPSRHWTIAGVSDPRRGTSSWIYLQRCPKKQRVSEKEGLMKGARFGRLQTARSLDSELRIFFEKFFFFY